MNQNRIEKCVREIKQSEQFFGEGYLPKLFYTLKDEEKKEVIKQYRGTKK